MKRKTENFSLLFSESKAQKRGMREVYTGKL